MVSHCSLYFSSFTTTTSASYTQFSLSMAEKHQHDQQQVGFSLNTKIMKTKRPKKLDFNAPLISTRRFMCRSSSSRTSRSYTAERVPFCWEQVPGKPKDMHQYTVDEQLPPTPKPPPSQWHPSSSSFDLTHSSTDDKCIQPSDGFDADVDDNDDDDGDKGMYSDAMDMFSLSEAIDFVQKETEKAQIQRGHGLDGFNAKTAMSSDCEEDYPSFIIQRFLPAATALAASSVVTNASNKQQVKHGSGFSDDERKMRAYATGCGLDNLFTWRIKHKPCGISSPVCKSQSSSVNLKCQHLRGKKWIGSTDGFKGSKT